MRGAGPELAVRLDVAPGVRRGVAGVVPAPLRVLLAHRLAADGDLELLGLLLLQLVEEPHPGVARVARAVVHVRARDAERLLGVLVQLDRVLLVGLHGEVVRADLPQQLRERHDRVDVRRVLLVDLERASVLDAARGGNRHDLSEDLYAGAEPVADLHRVRQVRDDLVEVALLGAVDRGVGLGRARVERRAHPLEAVGRERALAEVLAEAGRVRGERGVDTERVAQHDDIGEILARLAVAVERRLARAGEHHGLHAALRHVLERAREDVVREHRVVLPVEDVVDRAERALVVAHAVRGELDVDRVDLLRALPRVLPVEEVHEPSRMHVQLLSVDPGLVTHRNTSSVRVKMERTLPFLRGPTLAESEALSILHFHV